MPDPIFLVGNEKFVVFNERIVAGGGTACFAANFYLETFNLRDIRGLFIFVKVGARFPRPHIVGEFSDSLKSPDPDLSEPYIY